MNGNSSKYNRTNNTNHNTSNNCNSCHIKVELEKYKIEYSKKNEFANQLNIDLEGYRIEYSKKEEQLDRVRRENFDLKSEIADQKEIYKRKVKSDKLKSNIYYATDKILIDGETIKIQNTYYLIIDVTDVSIVGDSNQQKKYILYFILFLCGIILSAIVIGVFICIYVLYKVLKNNYFVIINHRNNNVQIAHGKYSEMAKINDAIKSAITDMKK